MPTPLEAHRLMAEAAKPGVSLAESARLVAEANAIKTASAREAAQANEVDLAEAIVRDHLVPVRVHEHHTASTDWLADVDTGQDLRTKEHEILAQASLWYGKTASLVKEYPDEFAEQARGVARKMAGAYGEEADAAENLFLSHVGALHTREVKSGTVKVAADAVSAQAPEAGGGTFDVFPTGNYEQAIDGDLTSSNRAPQIQELEGAPSSGATDVTPQNDPGLGVTNSNADVANGDSNQRRAALLKLANDRDWENQTPEQIAYLNKHLDASDPEDIRRDMERIPEGHPFRQHLQNYLTTRHQLGTPNDPFNLKSNPNRVVFSNKEGSSMQHAQCPTCGGHGRVAVRRAPQNPKEAFSGLPQIQQVVDPSDTQAQQTPLPAEVAFPWVMNPADIQKAISQTEQQVAERNAKSPLASQASVKDRAQKAAEAAYRQVLAGGYDDSGWAGDMGAQGWQPGQQDGGNAPSSNLGQPDPVYGYGGDQPDRAVKPYGAMEADDFTNNPGQNWQPGQPTQMDMGGRQMSTDAPNTYQTGPNAGQKAASADPEIAKAQAFISQRQAWLQGQGH
jgi:hypothetical protein